ncbi:MAG: lysine--tRNA ligase, partial [Psychrobacillus sp.]
MSNMEELNDQLLVRRQKMTTIQEKGLDPFGGKFERTHLSDQVVSEFEEFTKEQLEETPHEVVIA